MLALPVAELLRASTRLGSGIWTRLPRKRTGPRRRCETSILRRSNPSRRLFVRRMLGVARAAQLVLTGATLARIAETQLLLRGLGEISEGFHFAAESAVDFDKRVAEIRTISTEKNLDALRETVRSLSDEFNRPLNDVAEGYYQTLSNQVGDAAQSTKFLATALRFGKVAVTETGDSVNLLAGCAPRFQSAG